MHARLRLDVGWWDLLAGGAALCLARDRAQRARRIEQLFSKDGDAFVALSVRTGFDLYLRALALPAGSEVLVSGLTIAHMVQILETHGLRPVPFALDPGTLGPAPGELERNASPRTRAVLFAHLFGVRAELGALADLARRRRWLFWEDGAQAFGFDGWRGHPSADLSLFSFGLIKTATAIQGGILRVRERAVRERMRELQASYPVQRRPDQARRLAKAAVLRALSHPAVFGPFAAVCARRGKDLDQVLHAATRGFPGPDFLERLRRAPSAPLLSLLERRLRHPRASFWEDRKALGEELLARLGQEVEVLGRGAHDRLHWVFVVSCSEPHALVGDLRRAGFDATARSSLVPVGESGGEPCAASKELLEHLVYVPLALESTERERRELVRILHLWSSRAELRARGVRSRVLHGLDN